MKNLFKIARICILTILFISKVKAQQTVYKASNFLFEDTNPYQSDYIAREKIEMKPASIADVVPESYINLKIDKEMQIPLTYQSEATNMIPFPESVSIDNTLNKSLPVGSLDGEVGNSSSGSATYNFAIYTPPGTNNMVPQIGISYNSSSTDGLLGRGWNINGVSAISRVPKTLYHNQIKEGILLNSTDNFALDGNRLIASPTNGANKFRSEKEDFNLISVETVNGIDYFTVETKSGLLLEYGKNTDSRFVLKDESLTDQTMRWYLNKIIDKYGNYMTYEYYNNQGEITLKKIDYTGTTVELPYNSIRFYYDKRKDTKKQYLIGNEIKSNLILREVEVLCEFKPMKRYVFNYVFNVQSFLREIIEYGSDNTHLNSTIFKYGEGSTVEKNFRYVLPQDPNSSFDDHVFTQGPIELENSIVGDFNGDGKMDQVQLSPIITGSQNNLNWKLWLNINNSLQEITTNDPSYPSSNTILQFLLPSSSGFGFYTLDTVFVDGHIIGISRNPTKYAQAMDMNNDGLDDMVICRYNAFSTPNDDQVMIFLSNGHGFKLEKNFSVNRQSAYLFADFDGDNKPEMLTYEEDGYNGIVPIHFKVFNLNSGSTPTFVESTMNSTLSGSSTIYKNFSIVDFDGDGIVEILANNFIGESVFIKINYNGNSFTTSEIYSTPKYLLGNSRASVFGDFNGDGLIDFFHFGKSYSSPSGASTGNVYTIHNQYNINYNNSKSLITASSTIAIEVNGNGDYLENFLALDYNNDGADDIIRIKDNGVDKIYLDLYYNGIGTKIPLGFIPRAGLKDTSDYATSLTYEGLPSIIVLDFDGDGFQDILYEEKGLNFGYKTSLIQFNRGTSKGLLKEIFNGFGNKINLNYSNLVSSPNGFYERENNGSILNNIIEISPATFALQSIVTINGNGVANVTSFNYKGLKLHTNGNGILGFTKELSYNSISKLKKEIIYDINFSYCDKFLKANKEYKVIGNIETLLFENSFNMTYENLGGVRFLNHITHEERYDYVADFPVVIDYTYDLNNNDILTKKITNVNNNLMVTTEDYSPYSGLYGSWMPSKINLATVTSTRNNGPVYSRTTVYEYDQLTGSISKIKSDPNTPIEKISDFFYGSHGELIDVTTNGFGNLPTLISHYEYDDKFRFATIFKNTKNQISETKYDPRWGKVIWQKGIDGNINETFYDGYGNIIKNISPDKTISSISTTYVQSGAITAIHPYNVGAKASVVVTNHITGKPSAKTYYDKTGRLILKEEECFNNTIYSAMEYDDKGNLFHSTNSYYESMLNNTSLNKIINNTYSYDYFNRLVSAKSEDGIIPALISSNVYDEIGNGEVKITSYSPDGKKKVLTKDATGLLISAEDNNGNIITYTYDGNGQVETTSLSGEGIQTIASYYPNGTLHTLKEKNSAIITYEFDAYGRKVSQKQDGKDYFFTYNNLNQLETKTGPEGVFNYTYNSLGFGINQPHIFTGPNGNNIIEFSYDNLNRIIQKKETINGEEFKTQYTYDSKNNLTSLTYPSGFAINYSYDSKGYNTQINRADNGALIWKADEINALGQITKFTLGNKPQSEQTFTNYGLPKEFKTNGIQNLTFNFDESNGNMLQRKDIIKNLQEDFSYTDGLDRLNTMQVLGQNLDEVTYHPNGNIESKTNIGVYGYTPTNQPNAVKLVENTGNLIRETSQNITYTGFNKVVSIIEDTKSLDYTYGIFDERKTSILSNDITNEVLCKRIYVDNYEKTIMNGNIYELTFIHSATGLAAIFVKENGDAGKMYYVYSDNLGSLNTIVDDAGNKIEQNFDAWGNRRNPIDWTTTNIPTMPNWLYRGYTGHEHLNDFELINMNGRMYDPLLGRMLSPDIFLQDPTNSQNFNRYSYTFNNPLKYTDPSGWQLRSALSKLNYRQDDDAGIGNDLAVVAEIINQYVFNSLSRVNYVEGTPAYAYGKYPDGTSGGQYGYIDPFTGKFVAGTKVLFAEPIPPSLSTYNPPLSSYAQSNGGGNSGFNQQNVDFAGDVLGILSTASEGAAYLSKMVKAVDKIGYVGAAITATTYVHALATEQAKPAHHLDAAITGGILMAGLVAISLPVVAPYALGAGLIYGGARMLGGEVIDDWFNSQFIQPQPIVKH